MSDSLKNIWPDPPIIRDTDLSFVSKRNNLIKRSQLNHLKHDMKNALAGRVGKFALILTNRTEFPHGGFGYNVKIIFSSKENANYYLVLVSEYFK